MSVSIGPAPASELLDLRRRVLRDGKDEPPSVHVADDDPATIHLAARDDGSGEIVGCVTLARDQRSFDGVDVPVHLVLMAVAPGRQGERIGERLIAAAKAAVPDDDPRIWAGARSTALGFYERCGFRVVSDEFVGAMHLPHHLVVWP